MDAGDAAAIVVAVATSVLALGVNFAYLQVRHLASVRETDATLRLYELGQVPHVREAASWLKYVFDPERISYEQLYASRTDWDRFSDVNHYFELVGTLVMNRYVSRDLVFDLMGTFIAGTWEKVEPIVREHRAKRASPTYMENFELLQTEFARWAEIHAPKIEGRLRRLTRGYYRQHRATLG
jgi:hypothetical protein